MLYLIGGDNVYLSTKRLEELKEEFTTRFDGMIKTFHADEIRDYNDILSDADSLSLFTEQKLIVVKRLFSTTAGFVEQIYEYLKTTKDSNIVFWEDKSFDKRRSLYKYIKKKGVVEEFTRLKFGQLRSWVNKYLGERCEFESECADALVLKIGDDQMQLSLVIDNLVDLIDSENREKLRVEDIDKFVEKTMEESIWEFTDALGEYDKAKALQVMERLLVEKEDFMKIVGMLARQFRILAMVKYLSKIGRNHAEITSELKLHPFVVRKAVSHSRNFTFEKIRKLYYKLLKTDLVVKQGRFDEKLALDLWIAAL